MDQIAGARNLSRVDTIPADLLRAAMLPLECAGLWSSGNLYRPGTLGRASMGISLGQRWYGLSRVPCNNRWKGILKCFPWWFHLRSYLHWKNPEKLSRSKKALGLFSVSFFPVLVYRHLFVARCPFISWNNGASWHNGKTIVSYLPRGDSAFRK